MQSLREALTKHGYNEELNHGMVSYVVGAYVRAGVEMAVGAAYMWMRPDNDEEHDYAGEAAEVVVRWAKDQGLWIC